MARKQLQQQRKVAAACARAAWAQNITSQPKTIIDDMELPLAPLPPLTDTLDDIECTSWTGGVIYILSDLEDDLDEHWTNSKSNSDSWSENHSDFDDLVELEGEELIKSLQIKCWYELNLKQLAMPMPYESLLHTKTQSDWKTAEARRALGYNGLSRCRKWEVAQQIQEKDAKDKVTRNRWAKTSIAHENLLMWQHSKEALKFQTFFSIEPSRKLELTPLTTQHTSSSSEPSQPIENDGNTTEDLADNGIFCGYLSDQSNAKLDCDDWSNCEGKPTDTSSGPLDSLSQPGPLLNLQNSPLPKRRKLDISAQESQKQKHN